jgi:hypothetical protein
MRVSSLTVAAGNGMNPTNAVFIIHDVPPPAKPFWLYV